LGMRTRAWTADPVVAVWAIVLDDAGDGFFRIGAIIPFTSGTVRTSPEMADGLHAIYAATIELLENLRAFIMTATTIAWPRGLEIAHCCTEKSGEKRERMEKK